VFVSYAHQDERLRSSLVRQLGPLEAEGPVKLWHDRKIPAGAEWKVEIDEHLKSSCLVLLLLSPDFLKSKYCREFEARLALERSDLNQARIVPVVLRPCAWRETPFGRFQALPRNGRPVSDWASRKEAIADVVEGIRAVVEDVRRELLSSALPPIWNVPFRRNPNFTGRTELLRELHAALSSGRAAAVTQAISGLGGVGKTQLAVEYAYRHASDYALVWWLRSEDSATLTGDYAQLAGPLDLPMKGDKDQGLLVKGVKRWLEANKGWLLIFDNAEQPEDLKDYLPQVGSGHIIVTSRNTNWRRIGETLPVEVLPREQAIRLLLRRSGSKEADRDAAANLAEELGDLPLALEQAAAYVDETACTMRRYLELLSTHRKDVLSRKGVGQDYPASVATTWEISFQRLEQESPAATELLNLCAFLAPDAIPLDLLAEGRKHLSERLSRMLANPVATDELKAALRRYSLAEVKGDNITLHRLVQVVTRNRMAEEQTEQWLSLAVRLMEGLFPTNSQDVQAWPRCSRLEGHAVIAAKHAVGATKLAGVVSHLMTRVGMYLYGRSKYANAEPLFRVALQHAEMAYGPRHAEVADALTRLAWAVRHSGDPEPLLRRALEIAQEAFGPEDMKVAELLGELGIHFFYTGRAAEGVELCRRALITAERVLPLDDLRVAGLCLRLGEVLLKSGQREAAEEYFGRCLSIRLMKLGPDHTYTGEAYNALGQTCERLGKTAEAEQYLRKALDIAERTVGPDHFNTGFPLTGLATMLAKRGAFDEADRMLLRALRIWEPLLGPDNSLVGHTHYTRGRLYQRRKDYAQSLACYERADAIARTQSDSGRGRLHILKALGELHLDFGHHTEAEQALTAGQEIAERLQDDTDSQYAYVPSIFENLARLYEETGRPDEARQARERAESTRKKHKGQG
jgi:tetratricopeptide (TPR) repeat protein